MDERSARMSLCALQSLGNPQLSELVAVHGAVEVWEAILGRDAESTWGRRASIIEPGQLVSDTHKCSARFVVPGDEEWPDSLDLLVGARLSGQGGPPLGLWVRGTVRLDELAGSVAVVGARASTSYGNHVATEFGADLGLAGRVVVSGLAFGIDAAAHRGALSARHETVAVLANGVDSAYPVAHTSLMEGVIARGAVVSEAPPGCRPLKAAFLARNRLIAALTDGVVVVEAAARSGARNTASWAAVLGRHVMAVPGPVTSSLSVTPHRLIREATATLVTSVAEVIELLSPFQPELELPLQGEDRPLDRLPERLRVLREAVAPKEEVNVSDFMTRTGLSVPECLAGVDELVELGWLEQAGEAGWRLPGRRR
ncbi:DNA-processing protein DprA [Tessaracoccus antarcticus]|uniref:DNA-protecting protein DprA n=1 Tax=Tessaracoccus antarcticus TaxID=2479848 RepID=A0A3M0GSJ9_9ACTN|nr:DNA-processing protein DprA [Tessaracoccus antarcticus]RMB60286.1 DNA-protecting protein DprA [Tessaracoccus antarcticus]